MFDSSENDYKYLCVCDRVCMKGTIKVTPCHSSVNCYVTCFPVTVQLDAFSLSLQMWSPKTSTAEFVSTY